MPSFFQGSPSRGRRFLQFVTILGATIALLEIALRGIGLTNLVLYADDPETGYRIKPGQTARYLDNRIQINAWGVRDARTFEQKNEAVLRVLVLGDSVTWGGLREPQENLFTSILEDKSPGSEVINAGVNGFSVAQMVALYQAHLSGLEPDIVLVIAIPRDFTRPPQSRLVRESVSFPRKRPRFAVPVAIEIFRFIAQTRWGWNWLALPPATEPVGPALEKEECLRRNLDALVAFALEMKDPRQVLFVMAPYLKTPINEELPTAALETLHARGVRTVDLNERIRVEPELFVDGVHLSSYGHRKLAEELALLLRAKADFGLAE